jgi:hypothetical protein
VYEKESEEDTRSIIGDDEFDGLGLYTHPA